MADEFGIDLGNAFARAEDIKAARIRNKFAERNEELGQQRTVLDNEMAAINLKEAQRGFQDETTSRNARSIVATAAGLPAGEKALVTISPAKAQELQSYLDGLDENGRKRLEENIDALGRAAAYVKTSEDPEKAFLEVRGILPPDVQKQWPTTYDADYIDATVAQALEITDILTGGKGKQGDAPSGYEWNPDGSLKPIKGGPHDPAVKGGGGIETAAANGIKSTVALAFGTEFNPTTGEFAVLDPQEANQMIDVIALAQEKLIANPGMAPGRAVEQALKEANITPGGGNAMAGNDDDPLGILGQ